MSVATDSGSPIRISVETLAAHYVGEWSLAKGVFSQSGVARLTGLGNGLGSLAFVPEQVSGLAIGDAVGTDAIGLTVGFGNGIPIPSHPGIAPGASGLSLVGNPLSATAESFTHLVMVGVNSTGFFQNVTHAPNVAASPNGAFYSGLISFLDRDGNTSRISYSGLGLDGVYDTVAAYNYTFIYAGDPGDGVLASSGAQSPSTSNFSTLKFSSTGATPQFVNTHVAYKTSIRLDMTAPGDRSVTVDVDEDAPIANLSTLEIDQGPSDDEARVINLPILDSFVLRQGGGDDRAYISLPGRSHTTSTLLDGGPGIDTLAIEAGGLAVAASNFSVGPGGVTRISGPPFTNGWVDYVRYEGATISGGAPTVPTVFGVPIHGNEGQQSVNVLVGAFTAPGGFKASDFVATVAWGDGKSDGGTIVQDASNPSVYYVYGTHTYTTPGTFTTTNTVRPLAATSVSIIGGIPVAFVSAGGTVASQIQTAFIQDAGLSLNVQAFSGTENTPLSTSSSMVVATFTDLGGVDPTSSAPAALYSATIFWGDGTPGVAATITRNGSTGQFIVSATPHTHALPGSYAVTVVVKQADGGATAAASSVAHIADAALTAAAQPTQPALGEGTRFVDLAIGAFNDANPLATIGEYKVMVDWGDGTGLQAARVVQPNGVGTTFYILGTHAYANALPAGASPIIWIGVTPSAAVTLNGAYNVTIYVQDTYGSAVNLTNTPTVADNAMTVAGYVDTASDTGISNTDGVTNDNTPSFSGWISEAGASVAFYASLNGGLPFLIGATVSDASNVWRFTPAAALVDGDYTISAQAIDASGHTVSPLTTLRSGLVIDTVGPKVTNVLLDGYRGQAIVTFNDYGGVANVGSGLALAAVHDANNYVVTKLLAKNTNLRPWLATSVTISPETTTGEQVATVQFNGGAQIRGGKYLFKAHSIDPSNLSGICDVAGNALDGEFYGYFPSGNNLNGGNFVAELVAIHHTVFPPRAQVGTASPVSPPGRAATGLLRVRGGGKIPLAASRLVFPRRPMGNHPHQALRPVRYMPRSSTSSTLQSVTQRSPAGEARARPDGPLKRSGPG